MGHTGYDKGATRILRAAAVTSGYTDTFTYDADVKSGRAAAVLHDSVNPAKMKEGIRESRDSTEHPESVPIAVCIDQTGSMSTAPKRLFDSIGSLLGAIVKNGAIEHPHVLFSAVGDAYCDAFPFQAAQFEAGNEMEEQISKFILEGGGGGNSHESYDLYMYFLARCVRADSWEKRGKRGYAFLIQDEPPPDTLPKTHVKQVFDQNIEANISFKDIIKEAQEKWNIFILRPQELQWGRNESITKQWEVLFGADNVIRLQSIDGICEQIALIIAREEGVDLDAVADSLVSEGSNTALVLAAKTAVGGSKAIVKAKVDGDLNIKDGTKTPRL